MSREMLDTCAAALAAAKKAGAKDAKAATTPKDNPPLPLKSDAVLSPQTTK